MTGILDYLGMPTKEGYVFQEGDTNTQINDFVQLSSRVYDPTLHSCIVDELKLNYEHDGASLTKKLEENIKKGLVPKRGELPIKSLEFDEELGSGFLACEPPAGSGLYAACAVCSPVDGYDYSAGIDVNGDPEIHIQYSWWKSQSHVWGSPVIKEKDNPDLSLANSLIGMKLAQEGEGTRRITFYESIHSPEWATSELLKRGVLAATNGEQDYYAKFPMFDKRDKGAKVRGTGTGRMYRHTNNGRLYMIELEDPKTSEELKRIEKKVISALWGK